MARVRYFFWLFLLPMPALCQGLSEGDLLKLVRSGTSEADIATRLDRDGLSFEMDSVAVERLGKAGLSPALLNATLDARINIGKDPDDLIRRGRLPAAAAALSAILTRH